MRITLKMKGDNVICSLGVLPFSKVKPNRWNFIWHRLLCFVSTRKNVPSNYRNVEFVKPRRQRNYALSKDCRKFVYCSVQFALIKIFVNNFPPQTELQLLNQCNYMYFCIHLLRNIFFPSEMSQQFVHVPPCSWNSPQIFQYSIYHWPYVSRIFVNFANSQPS